MGDSILHERLQVAIALSLTRATRMCGEVLIEAGSHRGSGMFFLTKGEVGVIIKDTTGAVILLTTVGVGSVFGEMSLLSDQRPSATIIAREVSEAFNMSREAFASIVARFPRFQGYIQKVADARKEAAQRQAATATFGKKEDGGKKPTDGSPDQKERYQHLAPSACALPSIKSGAAARTLPPLNKTATTTNL